MTDTPSPSVTNDNRAWYAGISRYQWMVLVIASLGWVFDIFEGQIFVASSNEAMPTFIEMQERGGEVLGEADKTGRKEFYNDIAFACFLVGGAVGGIFFGMLSDRIGRKRTMTLTIVFYSLFTCLSAFSAQWWHLAGLRFLVAMGVGGEWAVASAMVFEVFPARARAHVGGIFHASSVFGTYLAVAAVTFFIGNAEVGNALTQWAHDWGITDPVQAASVKWRIGFALGALPALLIIWIRVSLKEPEEWQAAQSRAAEDSTQQVGRISELFSSQWIRSTLVGFSLASVGLATFWGVHIHGKATMRNAAEVRFAADQPDLSDDARKAALTRWEMLGMFLVTTGGGIGLLCFGPLSQRIGRKPAFLAFHLGGLVSALVLFSFTFSQTVLYGLLPLFGFLTLGMHAGYAIYFPELFPTRLRGTGTGFCFNGGRIAAAPILYLSGWMKNDWGYSLSQACILLSLLYLLGLVVLLFAPETRGRELHD
ncbi:MAG: MFS transporter [Planctomycetaceae bacterium]|nr:MFS transporter [Planctomycetaceae bacterium]